MQPPATSLPPQANPLSRVEAVASQAPSSGATTSTVTVAPDGTRTTVLETHGAGTFSTISIIAKPDGDTTTIINQGTYGQETYADTQTVNGVAAGHSYGGVTQVTRQAGATHAVSRFIGPDGGQYAGTVTEEPGASQHVQTYTSPTGQHYAETTEAVVKDGVVSGTRWITGPDGVTRSEPFRHPQQDAPAAP